MLSTTQNALHLQNIKLHFHSPYSWKKAIYKRYYREGLSIPTGDISWPGSAIDYLSMLCNCFFKALRSRVPAKFHVWIPLQLSSELFTGGASPLTASKQWHNIGKTFLSPIDGKQPNDAGWMINSPLFFLPSLFSPEPDVGLGVLRSNIEREFTSS